MSPTDRDVLTSLPNTRPTRRSAKRASTAKAEAPAAKPAAKPKATPKRKPAPKPAAAPRAATAKPKAAPAPAPPVVVPPSGWATPRAERPAGGGDLVGTTLQAVGELTQIGLTYGGQALKQALSRLPKP